MTREKVADWVSEVARWIEVGAAWTIAVLVVQGVTSGTSLRDAILYPQIWWALGVGIGMSTLRLIINRVFHSEKEGPEPTSTEQNAENL